MKLLLEKTLHLRTLYVDQIRQMLSAEEQIADGLAALERAVADEQLRQTFQSHVQDGQVHIARLQTILNHTEGKSEQKKCKSVSALLDEAEDLVDGTDKGPIRDAALVSAAQRIGHYQIAVYGALRDYAQLLELKGDAEALDRTMKEERHADSILTGIAGRINHVAFQLR
jgi:ferritin-like metal-binding protein YciE